MTLEQHCSQNTETDCDPEEVFLKNKLTTDLVRPNYLSWHVLIIFKMAKSCTVDINIEAKWHMFLAIPYDTLAAALAS